MTRCIPSPAPLPASFNGLTERSRGTRSSTRLGRIGYLAACLLAFAAAAAVAHGEVAHAELGFAALAVELGTP